MMQIKYFSKFKNRNVCIIILVSLLLYTNSTDIFAQSYDAKRVVLTNFIVRMYNNAPFEGVRIVKDYDNSYLLSVLTLDKTKYQTESVMNRVASVKAMSQASRFFNGSNITSELIIHISKKTNDSSENTETIEKIREHSVGYVKALEQLTNFPDVNGRQVFIFYKRIDD
ncbi:hypothetical protein [uncultured Alistipes sp.]|uniref:hypothetical protein n=1 Tax=uncultured Alistipes sp. TaxID=538949 RepID=UPI00272A6749|nr:hypothetical protein [uncultured Alistipes sp.]